MKGFRIPFLFFALSLFVFSCTADVREIKMSKDQYQIVVETKGKDMDETMAMFHDKAKSLCPDYEVVNMNTDVTLKMSGKSLSLLMEVIWDFWVNRFHFL